MGHPCVAERYDDLEKGIHALHRNAWCYLRCHATFNIHRRGAVIIWDKDPRNEIAA